MYSIIKDGGVCSPQGFLASGIKAGIKASGNADMALLKVSEQHVVLLSLPRIK